LSWGQSSTFSWDHCEVVKLVVCERDLAGPKGACIETFAVLYRSKLLKRSQSAQRGSTESLLSSPDVMRLVMYRLDKEFGPIVTDWVPIEGERDSEVVAIAVSKSGTALVLTRTYDGRYPRHILTKYSRRYDPGE
jgi:hypothetical protein